MDAWHYRQHGMACLEKIAVLLLFQMLRSGLREVLLLPSAHPMYACDPVLRTTQTHFSGFWQGKIPKAMDKQPNLYNYLSFWPANSVMSPSMSVICLLLYLPSFLLRFYPAHLSSCVIAFCRCCGLVSQNLTAFVLLSRCELRLRDHCKSSLPRRMVEGLFRA